MKVAVIGGGSTYTPEIINGFVELIKSFPLTELWLMDLNQTRLEIVGKFAQRMVDHQGNPFQVVLSTDRQAAITDASYVLTQLRVGMMPARIADEYLGKRHNLIGQETTGVGGFAKALRTVPIILQIAREMHRLAPNAWLVNFTNPAGLITQALHMYVPEVQSVGVCNVAITTTMEILNYIQAEKGENIDPSQARLDTLGLNHLSWHYGFHIGDNDLWPTVVQAYINYLRNTANPEFDPELIEALGVIPNYYLKYFYYPNRILQEQNKWPPSRGEEVMKIENELLKYYSDTSTYKSPRDLIKRGGAYYSTVATQLLNAHYNNLGSIQVVNVPNLGAIQEWPADWVLEMPCRVDRAGIHPINAKPLPAVCTGLLAQVKSYELLAAEAAATGDIQKAFQALVAHPLGPQASEAGSVLRDILKTNKDFLPLFG